LREQEVRIVGEDVGGLHGRKLLFDVQTGSAWVRTIEGLGR
jgi:chemotaxis receptor (MCP) glutamine deamidase CheD